MFVNSSSNSYRQRLFSANGTGSIVFIDPVVENYQTLAAGVFAGVEAIILDPSKDGIEQITEVLSRRKNISSVHIVSNGQAGKLFLGNAEVSSDTLDGYSEQLQSWANSLTRNADIFVYGCNVGAGEEGPQFIQDLSDLTGADIAASSDLTGSAARDKVFDYGLRNPFRFSFDPVTGLPVIGDVGWTQWEEINRGRGVNFGWPYYEGGNGVSLQQSTGYASLPEAQAFYASGQSVTAPIYARSHANGAIAIVMGDFYDNNRLIYGDVGEGNIYEATFDQNRNITGIRVFDSGLPNVVDMEKGPDGNMYAVNLGNGTIFRWVPA